MLLTFQINKQLICRTDKEIPVADSENFLYAEFSFSEEWEGTKTAIFNNGTAYSVILDEDNKCLVPWEVITESGFSVSVYCGERITANISFVKVLPTGYIEGQTPADPTPTVYEQIIDALNKKLEALNIKAGQNVTIDIDGNDVTINASGGGGGTSDYSQLANKPSINSVELIGNKSLSELGIQPSGDYATATALNSGLATKQNAFNVGKGLTLANDVLSADTNKQLFVGSLPTENIVGNAIYYTPNYALFSGVANYITTEYPTVVVTRQNDLPSKMLQMACNTNKNYGATAPKSYIYNIYDYVDGGWVLNQSSSVSVANNEWASKMGFPTNVTGSAATVRAQFESLIWYSSQDFSYERSYWGYKTVKSSDTPPTWRGNVTDANGVPFDTSNINFCLFNTYQYVNGAWVNYGVSDFSELFAHFNDVLNSKADASALSDYATISAMNTALATKQNVKSTATLTDNSTVALADNTDYTGTDLTTLTFTFPSGNFECYISMTTASSGTPSITFPNTAKWIGNEPTYENSKQYEFSVKNGVIVAGVVE